VTLGRIFDAFIGNVPGWIVLTAGLSSMGYCFHCANGYASPGNWRSVAANADIIPDAFTGSASLVSPGSLPAQLMASSSQIVSRVAANILNEMKEVTSLEDRDVHQATFRLDVPNCNGSAPAERSGQDSDPAFVIVSSRRKYWGGVSIRNRRCRDGPDHF
jgi:hypothetical protein